MKRIKKILLNFKLYSVEVLIELVRFVISSMTGNSYFATPDPTLAVIKDLVDDLEKKFILAQTGDKVAHADMIAARLLLEKKLRSLVLYVEKIADGIEVILRSSGFPLTGEPRAWQREEFWVKRGPNSGDIITGRIACPRARAYVLQYFIGEAPPLDDRAWIWAKVATKTRMGISGLEKARDVWVRSCAVTPDGMTPWTDPKHIVVG